MNTARFLVEGEKIGECSADIDRHIEVLQSHDSRFHSPVMPALLRRRRVFGDRIGNALVKFCGRRRDRLDRDCLELLLHVRLLENFPDRRIDLIDDRSRYDAPAPAVRSRSTIRNSDNRIPRPSEHRETPPTVPCRSPPAVRACRSATSPSAAPIGEMTNCTRPPTVSASASGGPLYGTCCAWMPTASSNITAAKCMKLPTPAEPKLSWFGFYLASAIKLFERVNAQCRRHQHPVRRDRCHRDGAKSLHRVVRQLGIERRRHRMSVGDRHQRVTIGDRSRRRNAPRSRSPAPGLFSTMTGRSKMPLSFVAKDPRRDVGRATGREADDDADHAIGVVRRRVLGEDSGSHATQKQAAPKKR